MIHICDAIMGSGKSSAAIQHINDNPDKKFLYLTPYLTEAARIKNACPAADFAEPEDRVRGFALPKSQQAIDLIRQDRSIASTHQALQFFLPETFDLLRDKGYTVIIDEALGVTAKDPDIVYGDIEFLMNGGYVEEFDTGMFRLTGKEYEGGTGGRFFNLFRTMKSRPLVCIDNDAEKRRKKSNPWFWTLAPGLFKKVEDIYILTYLFQGSELESYLKLLEAPYDLIGIRRQDERHEFSDTDFYVPEYVERIPQLICLQPHDKLDLVGSSRTALSETWFERHPREVDQLRRNLLNYFKNLTPGAADERMCASYKRHWDKIKGKGYTNSYVVFNERAKNCYRNRDILAYPVNVFANVGLADYYRRMGVPIDEDRYALSTMLQWIWRSAIRDGNAVSLYLPSARMRRLLLDWMSEVISA